MGPNQLKLFGMVVRVVESGIFVHKCRAAQKLLSLFSVAQYKPCKTPLPSGFGTFRHKSLPHSDVKLYHKIIRCLMYLSNTTRPDIVYAMAYLARILQQPLTDHWKGAKHVLWFQKRSQTFGIYNNENGNDTFECYVDSHWAQKRPDRKSITEFVFLLAGAP